MFPDYAALVVSDAIDAVYIALPVSRHGEWSMRALEAGKHVLCEKPIARNAAEADRMRQVARRCDRRLVEALHYRYHPLMERVLELVREGAIGDAFSLDAQVRSPFGDEDGIRFRYELGGGATMDVGCYPVHMVRTVAGEEPEVLSARARTGPPEVDLAMSAELRFPGGASGKLACSLADPAGFSAELRIRGSGGEIQVQNPLAPHLGHLLRIKTRGERRDETVEGNTSYAHQLGAFIAHVRDGLPVPTDAEDALANMHAIDAIYGAAGLPTR